VIAGGVRETTGEFRMNQAVMTFLARAPEDLHRLPASRVFPDAVKRLMREARQRKRGLLQAGLYATTMPPHDKDNVRHWAKVVGMIAALMGRYESDLVLAVDPTEARLLARSLHFRIVTESAPNPRCNNVPTVVLALDLDERPPGMLGGRMPLPSAVNDPDVTANLHRLVHGQS